MKVYRRSFWKAEWTKSALIPFAVVILLFICTTYGTTKWSLIVLFSLGGAFLIFSLLTTVYCYVAILPDKIIIHNPLCILCRGEFYFTDIEKIEIGNPGGLSPDHLLVFRNGKRRKRYAIDLVSPKDYRNLKDNLEKKGVKVEVKGIVLD